jgi:ferrous iron transport protein B
MENIRLALAGNPNSGKTTLFNALTGARQRVGNYPGITVDRKEGSLQVEGRQVNIVDLPGCYSLTAYSPEELVARNVLVTERPQAVVHVVDSVALERSLYLTVQFLELGFPVVIALNMMDEAKRKGLIIDSTRLARLLGVPVVETVARVGKGKNELIHEAVAHTATFQGRAKPLEISYGSDIDEALLSMTRSIQEAGFLTDAYPARWVALKYLEGDGQALAQGRKADETLSKKLEEQVDAVQSHCRSTLNSSPDAIIADYRYGYIASVLKQGVFSRDERSMRIAFSERADRLLTQRLLGPFVMLAVLYGVFYVTFTVGEIPMGWLEALFGFLGGAVEGVLPDGLLRSLLVSGVIDGVGGVLGFVPLIMIMFLALTLLEQTGYMARVAYMLDRVFRIFGLHGCSVMPFLISGGLPGGCAVPGIMATRTLRSPREKLATLLTAPFMTCGAKVPVFILLAAAFFQGMEAQVMFFVTLGAWFMALVVSKILRLTLIPGKPAPFIMELPPYRLPTLRGLLTHTLERTWMYIRKAGTVILGISILLWVTMTFPGLPEDQAAKFESMRTEIASVQPAQENTDKRLAAIDNLEAQAALRSSLAGRIGTFLEPVSQWAGFDWRTNIALVGGFAAKEVVVSTLGTAYSLGEVDPEEPQALSDKLANDPSWSIPVALSLMVFVLLYAPCFVTVVAMARESSWKWALFSTCFSTVLAFSLAAGVYRVSSLLV